MKIPTSFLCVILIIATHTCVTPVSAQETPIERNFQFQLRAKALGYVIIEDLWVRSFSIGTEIKYKNRLSCAVDVVHFRWRFEKEVYPIPGNYENYDEFSKYDARNFMAFELKYYPFKSLDNATYKFYVNGQSKLGKRHVHVQDDYPIDTDEVYRMNSKFHDLGMALGMQIGKKWGFDFNLGAAYRWESKSETIFQEDGTSSFTTDVKEDHWIPTIRVNFFYTFCSKSNN